jgi:hypothetical protein
MTRDNDGRVTVTLPVAAIGVVLSALLSIGGAAWAVRQPAPDETKAAAIEAQLARIDERQKAYEREMADVKRMLENIDKKLERVLGRR